MNESTFHLQPGDLCRLLDGPLMIYFGLQEHNDELQHAFGYWQRVAAFTESGPLFVTAGFDSWALGHIRKAEPSTPTSQEHLSSGE